MGGISSTTALYNMNLDVIPENEESHFSAREVTRALTPSAADVSYDDSTGQTPMVSILVDEVKEDADTTFHTDSNWRRWLPAVSSGDTGLRSTNAPYQDVAVYQLSSLLPPLLAAIFENVDLNSTNLTTLHRFHRLLNRIVEHKPDAYLDILAVIAYHTPRARYSAISLFMSYWPKAVGHVTVSRTFPTISYAEAIARATQGPTLTRRANDHPYAHQFVPWRFDTLETPDIFADWSDLRNSFADHYRDLFLTEADLVHRTYEELSVFFSILWTQLEILDNGIALGSIVVLQEKRTSDEGPLDEFELHYLVNLYEAYLSSGKLAVSDTLADYLLENNARASDSALFFSWNTLAFVASVIKLPPSTPTASHLSSSDLLSVGQPDPLFRTPADDALFPYEVVPLAHMRDQLGDQFKLFSEAAARYTLAHLFHLGFFQGLNLQQNLFDESQSPATQRCSFPVPLGLEVSTEVETLVSAIEACLSDLDLSVNEVGLLLVVRKFWPDGMLTDYALRRLSRTVVEWILSEDDSLATMLRDYVAQGRNLLASVLANNGGDYVASRRLLSSRYAARWMLALHDQDINGYGIMLFDLLVEHAQDSGVVDEYFLSKEREESQKRRRFATTDKVLHAIIKLSQASIVFTTFDDLFMKWLERASDLTLDQQPLTSLSRLFNREIETSQRFSIFDSRLTMSDANNLSTVNPLRVVIDTATGSKTGFEQTLHWLCLFVRSGVDISVPTFMQFASLAQKFGATLDQCSSLVKAVLWSAWLRSMGRQELQSVIALVHSYTRMHVVERLQSRSSLSQTLQLVRHSLATCLLLYGCDRHALQRLDMIRDDEVKDLPSRRKMHARTSTVTDPIIVNTALMDALKCYVETQCEDVCCLVAKFLNTFMNEAPFVEAYEVDNFILRNGPTLCACMWQFYAIQLHEISSIRTTILLRVLVVDVQPFAALLHDLFKRDGDWEIRLQAVMRLFRIIEDVTSPSFNVEDRQWRSSVIEVFYYFFSSMWIDDREEIRLSVDTWAQTLLPDHFNAITLCWNEALVKSPIADRVKLISFLNQLRSHFPNWRMLSWDAIFETLLENDFMQRNGDDEDGPASAHLQHRYPLGTWIKTSAICGHPLFRSLYEMIADGISIDINPLLKFKDHLVRLLNFDDVAMQPTGNTFYVRFDGLGEIPPVAYPCLNDLTLVLDSSEPYNIAPSAMGGQDETTSPLLVGSVFVDVLLQLFVQAEALECVQFTTLKSMLKSLIIVIHKHDLDSKPLQDLQPHLRKAMKRILDLLLMDLSYEIRQLCLTACQAYIKRFNPPGSFICDVIEIAAKVMMDLNFEQNSEDLLVDQTRLFLYSTLFRYSGTGVMFVLCKRKLSSKFFAVLRYVFTSSPNADIVLHYQTSLRDSLLHEVLKCSINTEQDFNQFIVDNIQLYVEIVHHAGYGPDLMQTVGTCLVQIVRRASDWPTDTFDPSPFLLVSATLIQNNKSQSRELLSFMDTLLRASLGRFHVSVASLRRLLQVTTALFKKAKTAASSSDAVRVNPVLNTMFDILRDSLRVTTRISPATLTALIDALTATPDRGSSTIAYVSFDLQRSLAHDAFDFLCGDNRMEGLSQANFTASQTVAKLVLQTAEAQPSILERLSKGPMSIRAWNVFLLAALNEPSGALAALLFEHFSAFSLAYSTSLTPYQHPQQSTDPDAQDIAYVDISYAYAAIKLWLLLARKAAGHQRELSNDTSTVRDGENFASKMVWNELWPPFESVISAFEVDAHTGNLSPLASSVWASVADLFLFIRQSRSVVALNISSQTRIVNRLRTVVRAEAKLTRVLRSMTESPPDVALEFFVNQVTTEIWAEEKLQAAKRQYIMTERGRRTTN
ncbi:hypothetical protein A0H81_04216 [Grifola frondosa]|uniref:Uncharacterized protein n=1 Tax=Grifola frondosa TaxID=5627 RepID=A0A1C7MF52_GRIFR|nr:hypothetical protein A0H81_04216 [Grifola frondosa]